MLDRGKSIIVHKKTRMLTISLLFIMFIILLAYSGRSIIRANLFPSLVSLGYKNDLQASFDKANLELNYPFKLLNYTLDKNYTRKAECSLDTAYHFSMEASCFVSVGGESQVIDNSYIQIHSNIYEEIQQSLKDNGWQESTSEETPTSLVALLKSADSVNRTGSYKGYIRYDKAFSGNSCWITFSRFDRFYGGLTCDRIIELGRTR